MSAVEGNGLVDTFGDSIIERLQSELGAQATDDYPDLRDIKNLKGESTGSVTVYKADKLIKATWLSINVAPGARYFNIQVTPEAKWNLPRFSTEGMVTVRGSQVSMDMFPDYDIFMDIPSYVEQMAGVNKVYDSAKKLGVDFSASRFPHMRAFCSPFFLNAAKAAGDQLPTLDTLQNEYFDEWIKLYAEAAELTAAEARTKETRRGYMSEQVIAMDPDRQMIVNVFGEETTSAIERAVMYY